MRERFRRRRATGLDPDDPSLVVIAVAADPAEADSTVLARATGWRPATPAVLRHHLALPPESVERARELLATDGWRLQEFPRGDGRSEHRSSATRCAAEPGAEQSNTSGDGRSEHRNAAMGCAAEPGAEQSTTASGGGLDVPGGPGTVRLVATRVQMLDALHCAQERSRMAGLAQRLGGEALGWDALQTPG
ncbi:hypothetical protein [Longimycelium tulufanense]|uniref:hypothetical protein n=1 Tax=Longimycelium tulufanense TaxID=907463 RepID=UPI00357102A0